MYFAMMLCLYSHFIFQIFDLFARLSLKHLITMPISKCKAVVMVFQVNSIHLKYDMIAQIDVYSGLIVLQG